MPAVPVRQFTGDKEKVKDAIRTIISYLGEDLGREGLKDTPERVLRSWDRIYGGYLFDTKDVMTTFEETALIQDNQIILLKDIEFYSNCEHHIQPFFGKAHVAYMPNNMVVGISKLARIVDIYSRRLQIQERIGDQVTSDLMTHLNAQGAACILEAKHFCMTCRGVEKQNSVMVTSSLKGIFLSNAQTRNELMSLIRH